MSALEAVNRLLASGKYQPFLAVIKGLRNGIVYGTKIRFPHALVMTLLFKSGRVQDLAYDIAYATYTHSKNLGQFVFTYKALTTLLRELESGKAQQYHSFLAAFIGGWMVFGKYNKVNEQINLYLLSRVIYGFVRMGMQYGYIPDTKGEGFPWFAALIWGIVLWQFEYHKAHLQPSLQSSMTYLYHDSNTWHSIRDFLIYNK